MRPMAFLNNKTLIINNAFNYTTAIFPFAVKEQPPYKFWFLQLFWRLLPREALEKT